MANYYSLNIEEELLKDRVIVFDTEFNNVSCSNAVKKLLYLEKIDHISCDVATIGSGICASMGFMLVISGTKGKRYIQPNAQLMAHAVSSGTSGVIHDQIIRLEHSKHLNDLLMKQIAEKTGNSLEHILNVCQRDYWLTAETALEFGAVDKILEPKYKNRV